MICSVRAALAAAVLGAVSLTGAWASAVTPRLDFLFMVPPTHTPDELRTPLGLAYDPASERLYLADTGHSRVLVYGKSGLLINSFKHWIKYYDGTRILGEPWRLLPCDRGMVLVSDRLSDRVDLVDMFGAVAETIDVTAAVGGKNRAIPGAMARDAAGNLYLLEHSSSQVVVFDRAWRKLRSFGPKYDPESRFKNLADLAVAPDGTTYVIDSVEDNVVRVFNPQGEMIREFARHGEKASDFHMPAAIALDGADRLWIADAFSQDVKVYTTTGQFLATFGGIGTNPGRFYFPSDIVVTDDRLYVLERAGARCQAFHILGS